MVETVLKSQEEQRDILKLLGGEAMIQQKRALQIFPLKTWEDLINYREEDPDYELLVQRQVTTVVPCFLRT